MHTHMHTHMYVYLHKENIMFETRAGKFLDIDLYKDEKNRPARSAEIFGPRFTQSPKKDDTHSAPLGK